ncbi:MAG: hypothetical protein H7249_13925, partial [Chitinophagaceae bacterium]|nr:hypothetical protein [Oligoflexus sp.]
MKIRALTIYGLNLSVASLLCSCKPTQVKGDVKEKTVEADAEGATAGNTSADRAMNDSDTVAVPSAVTGALLTCRTVESSNAIEVRVGCNFSDEKGARIPLASLASKANFSYTNTLPSGLTVNILPADSTYEGTYVFNGTDFASTNAFIQIVQFNVGLVGLVKGGADAVIGGLGKDIATPPAARWVRESTTDTNSNKLCDAGETCIYVGNGLYWLRDTGVAASHVLSSQTCNKFTYLGKYWSLPMLDAMK